MLKYNDPLRLVDDTQERRIEAGSYSGGEYSVNVDGYQCLEAFGDDLSLEDGPLLDMDDLLLTA